MKVHHSALKHGVDPEDSIKAATEYLVTVDLEEGNPSKQVRLGFDSTGQLLETVVLIFDDSRELVIHSMKTRRAYYDLLPSENTINGKPVSDAQIQEWADEAERGYDIAELKRRGRPRMGSAAAHVTTIRLDPELESALDERAEHDQTSRSDVIRDALREWLKSA